MSGQRSANFLTKKSENIVGKLGGIGIILLISLFIPVKLNIGSLLLTPYRIVILLAIVPALLSWVLGKSGNKITADYLLIFYVIWASIATLYNHGPAMIEKISIYFIEICGTYFIARWQFQNNESVMQAFRWLWFLTLLMIPFAVFELLTDRSLFQAILGPISVQRVYMGTRLGLHRAQTAFDHPILFGMLVGTLFAPAYLVLSSSGGVMKRGLKALVPAFATFCSLSAGAFVSVALQCGMIVWSLLVTSKKSLENVGSPYWHYVCVG